MVAISMHGRRYDLGVLTEGFATIAPEGIIVEADYLYRADDAWPHAAAPPEAVPIVDAHNPPLTVVEVAGTVAVDAVTRTTDDQPREVFRLPTAPQHVYRATFSMTGIDAASGATRDAEARMVFKRLAASLVQVGATAVITNFQDAAASSWAILPTVAGTDLVISVRGALGRTVDWMLVGSVVGYAPGGTGG